MSDDDLRELEEKIARVYERAAGETGTKLQRYLARFATKDAKKQALVKAGELSESEYLSWRVGQLAMGERWESMKNGLSTDLVSADKIASNIINKEARGVFAAEANYATYLLEGETNLDLSWTLYDENTVKRLLENDVDLLPQTNPNIPLAERWNKQHIQSEVLQGILQGESIPKIAKRLQNVAGMDKNAAIRNARTAMTGAQNAGRVESYKNAQAMGIDLQQEWLATLDGRTRHSHRQLDGERVDVGGKFSNGCRFPADPEGKPAETYNCRCTLVAAVKGYGQSNAPRNSKFGGMTYDEWKEAKAKLKS